MKPKNSHKWALGIADTVGRMACTRPDSTPLPLARRPKSSFLKVPVLGFALATVSAGLAFATSSTPCVPVGGSTDVSFARPPIDGAGMPTSAQWSGPGGTGTPQAFEDDAGFGDDEMGDATPGSPSDTASVNVRNDGGNLEGPNGDDQNGGFEGDCIEVEVCWKFRYKVTISYATKFEIDGVGQTSTASVEIWRTAWICSSTQDVCPC